MQQAREPPGGKARLSINQSDRAALAADPAIGEDRARAIIEARPFAQWHELTRAQGVDQSLIEQLQGRGVELGAPSQGPSRDLGVGAQPTRTIGRA